MTALNSFVTVEDLDFVEGVLANHSRVVGGGDCELAWHWEDEQYMELLLAQHLYGPEAWGNNGVSDVVYSDKRFQDLLDYAEATVLGGAEHILDRIAWRIECEWRRSEPGRDGIPF